MGIKKLIMILASLSFSATAFAGHHEDGESKPFAIYGDFASSMSFYDNEDFNTAGNHDDFSIDLIEINLEKNWSKSKLHLSIGYGATANAVNFGATNTTGTSLNTLNVMNAYYHMHTSYGLGFMVGKFESPVGHETYNHMDNSQYTRSWGFGLAPFFSTGLGVHYGQDMWKVGFLATNGRGADTDTGDKNKTMALTVDLTPMENLSIDLNYVTGTEGSAAVADYQVSLIDFSVDFMINEMFDVALNYIDLGQKGTANGSQENKASSLAAYVNANLGMFGLGLRYEQFSYDGTGSTGGGIRYYNGPSAAPLGSTGEDNTISSITLTAKAEIDQNAQFLLEFRQDSSDDELYRDKDNAATDSFSTITAAVMYRF